MEKFLENLEKAEKILQTASHLTYVTYSLVKDKKLLLKILSETKEAVANCINSILQYEYLYKRIRLSSDPKINLKTFIEKCAPRYNISQEDIQKILKLFELAEKHKKSPFEFVKEDKVVILSENMNSETVTIEKIKEFLVVSKDVLEKTKTTILR